MGRPTRQDVLDYARQRASSAVMEIVSDGWTSAASDFDSGNPDPMIKRLRGELDQKEEQANAHGERELCSGADHARGAAAEKARAIIAILWQVAEEYTPERVWGDQLTRRQAEWLLLNARARLVYRISQALGPYEELYGALLDRARAINLIADAMEQQEAMEANLRLAETYTALRIADKDLTRAIRRDAGVTTL